MTAITLTRGAGQVRTVPFPTPTEAQAALDNQRRGYAWRPPKQ
jgi:hypothetical protein